MAITNATSGSTLGITTPTGMTGVETPRATESTTGSGALGQTSETPPASASATTPADDSQALTGDALDEAVALLEASFGRSTSAEAIAALLGRLLIEQAQSQREAALNNRLTAREEAKSNLLSQANEMDAAAAKMVTGAIVSLAMTVIASVVSVLGAAASLKATMSGAQAKVKAADDAGAELGKTLRDQGASASSAMKNSGQLAQELKNLNLSKLDKLGLVGSQISQAFAGVATASGNFGKAMLDADSKNMEADGSRFAAEAQDQQADADMAKEIQGALDDMIKAIINFLKELQAAKAEQMQALTKV